MNTPETQGRGRFAFLNSSAEFRFAFDTLKKLFVFLIIALSAVGFHKIIEALEYGGIPPFIFYSLRFVEYTILVADVIWFTRVLVLEIFASIAEIFRASLGITIFVLIAIFTLGAVLSPHVKSLATAALTLLLAQLQ